jgi:arylsulfatase A-like enzyme
MVMAESSPNILWIVTTQWRAQANGYAGDPNARTPHIDALAERSVNYTQAVTPHPFGPFARAAMLTGVLSPENGVRDYFDPLPAKAQTIAGRLRTLGYATAFFGKWHLYERDQQADLVGQAHAKIVVPPGRRGGFEFWEGFESGFLLNDPWLHGTRLPAPVRFDGYQSDVVCGRAAEWMGDGGNRIPACGGHAAEAGKGKWFCMVSLEPPHPPYGARVPGGGSEWTPQSIVLPPNVPRGGDVEAAARRDLAGYYAHLEATDRAIGHLLSTASLENTVVVFTSVHGDMHGSHGLFRKGWPYEESVRVPLLVHVPGAAKGRRGVCDPALVSLVDLFDLTLRWAAGENPGFDRDIQRISMPSVVRLPHQCDRAWRGARTSGRKLVLGAEGAPWLFFDLERDSGEEINLCDDPSRKAEIGAFQQRL